LAALRAEAPRLDPDVLRLALAAAGCARDRGVEPRSPVLTVIDYSLPSTEKRMWVLDPAHRRKLFRELVAHGAGSGENYPTHFSNTPESHQSSLGLFMTAGTYQGRNGYSLRLVGLEEGFNHLALERTLVIHGAWYVSGDFARQHGRLGRSWGCPALPQRVAPRVIDTIKDGSLVFVYYPDERWLEGSPFLQECRPEAPASPDEAVTAGR
jgi:hypothetical protein